MFVTQISVFLENKPGRLAQVTEVIVDKPKEAVSVLKAAKFPVSTTEVLAVEVSDKPGGLNYALQVLNEANISIEYLYSFIKRNGDKALILFRIEDSAKAVKVLQSAGVKLYTNEEINLL